MTPTASVPLALVAAAVATVSCTSTGGEPVMAGPATTAAHADPAKPPGPHDGERYENQTSVLAPDGAVWEFAEGLSIRITDATRLSSQLGARSRGDIRLTLVRIDFSYTNNGPDVNLSEGRQLPVRLLYDTDRTEARNDGGWVGTSDQLTLHFPTTVEPGATVDGAASFVVPVAATDILAVLVVEPFRYTEHLFTEIEHLLRPA